MKILCAGTCRREHRVEWVRPGDDPWHLCAIHSVASQDRLRAAGWTDFPRLDDDADEAPRLTLTGGHQYETD